MAGHAENQGPDIQDEFAAISKANTMASRAASNENETCRINSTVASKTMP